MSNVVFIYLFIGIKCCWPRPIWEYCSANREEITKELKEMDVHCYSHPSYHHCHCRRGRDQAMAEQQGCLNCFTTSLYNSTGKNQLGLNYFFSLCALWNWLLFPFLVTLPMVLFFLVNIHPSVPTTEYTLFLRAISNKYKYINSLFFFFMKRAISNR